MNVKNSAKVLIVAAMYNKFFADSVLFHCVSKFKDRKPQIPVDVIRVPGSHEIPFTLKHFLSMGNNHYLGSIALGIVIRGKTDHHKFLYGTVSHAIMELQLAIGIPIINGVLLVDTVEQAKKRAIKGNEFADTLVKMIEINS